MLLQLKDIVFGFSAEKTLFSRISMDIEEGKVYALMGTNGSGKSTLLNIISGFLKIDSGVILFKKNDISKRQVHEINRLGVSRTFQDMRIISKLTVEDNIALVMDKALEFSRETFLPLRLSKSTEKLYSEKMESITNLFSLIDIKRQMASDISFGQQKLLSLACCYASNPSLMLLDEPIAGVQPARRKKIAEILNIIKKEQKSILLIEHNIEFISEVADRIIFVLDKKLLFFDSVEDLKSNDEVRKAYL